MATPIAEIAHRVNLVLGIKDHEREVVLNGQHSVYQERWLSVHCNRHPVAVMRAMGWRCHHYLSGTSADTYIYHGCCSEDHSWETFALQYGLDALFATLEPSKTSPASWQIVVPWHIFCQEMIRQGHPELTDIQDFFYNEDLGVMHLLTTQEQLLNQYLDRYPFGHPRQPATTAAVAN